MSTPSLEDRFEDFQSHGDAAALGEIFDACAPQLLRIARHVANDPAEAEDLVQGTFLAAIEKRDTFDRTRKLVPWLTGILLKQAQLARRSRRRVIEPDRLGTRSSEDPADDAGAREWSEALTAALAKLSAADRDVLIPLLLDGRRAVEIARELGRRPDTVAMRIHRGLARLRRILPAGFALSALALVARSRGLDAVKRNVMRHALASSGGAVAASLAGSSWGIAMTMKKLVLAATVLALGIGGYRLLSKPDGQAASSESGSRARLESAQGAVASESRDVARAVPDVDPSARTSVLNVAAQVVQRALELEVLREEREPAAAALVVLVDATGKLASARADAHGVCTLEVASGAADVFVKDDARMPVHARIDVAGGKQTLVLPQGLELSGKLRLQSGEALPEFELKLSTDTAPEGFARAEPAVLEALQLLPYGRPEILAETRPDRAGSFRFRGLPAAWSGALSLPTELVFVIDGKPTTSSERVFPSAASGLELSIAYRPRILGRLVEAVTRTPIANAEAMCTLEWSDHGDMMTNLRTDAQGRFSIALNYRTDAIGLRVADVPWARGKARVASIPVWTGACEPHDVGDVECTMPPARALELHVVDASRKPLAGARAGIAGLDVASGDAEGIVHFPAVPLDAALVRVVAPGHAIARIALTPEVVSPLEVALADANRLTLVLPAEAEKRSDLFVELVSRPLLFGGTSRMYDGLLRGGMIGWCSSADGDQGTKEGGVRIVFDEHGRIEVEDVKSGVPFRVQLHGSKRADSNSDSDLLTEIRIDSLEPTEQRRIDFPPECLRDSFAGSVSGRVLDERGEPILGANIATCFACNSKSASSDLEGRFHFDVPSTDPLEIEVSKRGFVPFRARDCDPRSNHVIEARLARGHDLRVELVDDHDRPIDGAYIRAELALFGPASRIEGGPTGVFTLCDLPAGDVSISLRIAGVEYTASHRSDEGVARIVLPEHGRLEVAWRWSAAPESSRQYRLALRPLGARGHALDGWIPLAEVASDHVFASVLPGEYALGIEVGTLDAARNDYEYRPLHEPVRVVVSGGATSRVELHP